MKDRADGDETEILGILGNGLPPRRAGKVRKGRVMTASSCMLLGALSALYDIRLPSISRKVTSVPPVGMEMFDGYAAPDYSYLYESPKMPVRRTSWRYYPKGTNFTSCLPPTTGWATKCSNTPPPWE